MSDANGEARVQKANMNLADTEFQTAKQTLDMQRTAADEMTRNIMQREQEKKGNQVFHSAKSRKALMNILSADFTSEKWILQKKGKRDSKKNIKAAHKKITGQGGLFGGLSRADKAARKSEFESRRIQSLEASQAVAALAAEADLGESLSPEEMVSSLSSIDVSKYNIESDADFVFSFAANMKELQKAEMLLDYFRSDAGRELMGKNQELSMKLFWMQSIKEAYMERITIISSPYYVSMRDEDFTPATERNMEQLLKNKKTNAADKAYFKAVLNWNKRKSGTLRHEYDFRFDKEQAYPEMRLKSVFYREARLDENMQKGMNEVADRDESGKFVERFMSSKQSKVLKDYSGFIGGATPGWMRDYEPASKDEFLDSIRKMQAKIKELLKAEEEYEQRKRDKIMRCVAQGAINPVNPMEANAVGSYKERLEREEFGERPTELSKRDHRRMQETDQILSNIIEKVAEVAISMDTARVWLDKTTGQLRLSDHSVGDRSLHRQDPEEYREKQCRLSDEEKEQELQKNISDLGSIVYKYSEKLGTLGYVSLRGAEDDTVRNQRFMHKNNVEKNRTFIKTRGGLSSDLSGDMEDAFKNLGKKVGNVIRIRGGRFHGENSESAYRVTISANPEWKNASVEELLAYASESGMLNYMHINIRTGVEGPGDDDITLLFSKSLTRENIKEFLDGYSERCAKKNPDILASDDKHMPGAAVKYKDGISIAPEIPVDMMQWIKEQTGEHSL